MAKRKNLRNPDILPFDYVSILLNWRTNSPLTATPTFTVAEVLGGTFPFNARMLSFTAVDSSSSISFVFQSPFDINTSPWQFELELAFTTTISKFRPTAVYNGSNNQVTVKFNVGVLTINTSYPVVFTAKRYRPTTQYLAQLAAAAQNPVTISPVGSITGDIVYSPTTTVLTANLNTYGNYFVAPNNFVINSIALDPIPALINSGWYTATSSFIGKIIKLPSFPIVAGASYINLFTSSLTSATSSVPVNLTVNTGDIIGIFSSLFVGAANSWYCTMTNNNNTPTTCTIGGVTATVNNLMGTGGDITNFTSIAPGSTYLATSKVNITTAGGTSWSNILY